MSVIPFVQEQVEDILLDALQKRDALLDLEIGIAALVYKARAMTIGGMCLPWTLLTPGQQAKYRAEVAQLIQKVEGE